jgi:hypothetical protein
MNNQLWGMLNATEQQLIRDAEPAALAGLDEDSLAALHDRVRKARNKYSKLYRRRASAQVGRDAGRATAHAQHARTAAKAEAFEDALARVSTRLARAARVSAKELRTERLAAARHPASSRPRAGGRPKSSSAAASSRRANIKRKTPATERARASTRATTARKQAERDSR